MECNRTCQGFCSWINTLPYHVRYTMPKNSFPFLPECFRETFLGERIEGSGRQLRGPYGSHVYEFGDKWVLHRDRVNADENPMGHLVNDAPEYLASLLLATAIGILTGRRSRDRALLAAGLTGAFAFISGKLVKILSGDPSDGDEQAPKLG